MIHIKVPSHTHYISPQVEMHEESLDAHIITLDYTALANTGTLHSNNFCFI